MAEYGPISDLMTLKKGDVIWECEYGLNMKVRLLEDAKDIEDGRCVEFKAETTMLSGDKLVKSVINYRSTKALRHYGPKLYTQPQYFGSWPIKTLQDVKKYEVRNERAKAKAARRAKKSA